MDTPSETHTVFSDDDEYDLISNPGHDRSLDSSLAELPGRLQGKDIPEPPPPQGARDKFETTRWTADDVQLYVRKTLSLPPDAHSRSTVRVYVDGAFDVFNVAHALQLRQAKLAFPFVHLVVGVFSDSQLVQYGYPPTWPEVERVEMVRHCRWVDEVITDIPWEVSDGFLLQRRIDYIAIDEGTSVDPNCDKARVKGYDEIKRLSKVISTRRTKGLSPVLKRLSSGLSTGPPTPVLPIAPRFAAMNLNNGSSQHLPSGLAEEVHPKSELDELLKASSKEDEDHEPQLDIFGIGVGV